MTPDEAYAELVSRSREEAVLESCQALLGWDELTYMPPGAVQSRGEQLAYLAGMQHEKATDPRVGELIARASELPVDDPYEPAAVNIREWKRSYERQSRLPRSLIEEQARLAPLSQQQWAESKQEGDFSTFRPWLEKTLQLSRAEAACLEPNSTPYDALLDDYEPGLRSAELDRHFTALQAELLPLLASIRNSKKRPRRGVLRRNFPLEKQRAFAEEVAAAIGFDFGKGRLDTAIHPFSTNIALGDCRIAIRYDSNQFSDAFFSLLHEVGHGLYEQGLDPIHAGTPLGAANSLGVHEAQARMWENLVGRSLPFWKYWFPRAKQAFPEALGRSTPGEFHTAVNHVEPGLNRVQADEVTYNLHIMVRYELEKAMLNGELAAADLPAAWNDAYRRTLGVTPTNDGDGCLQDGHWSEGLFGYFPTYTLGNLFGAQFFAAARAQINSLDSLLNQGDFAPLLVWLRETIHRQGSRYAPRELIRRATGAEPSHEPLVEGLRQKYREIYHF